MSLFQSLTDSFMAELAQAIHDFGGDTFKLALYDSNATWDETLTAYSSANEVTGTGYVAGGENIVAAWALQGQTLTIDFDDITWTALTVPDIRSGVIYNASKGNRAICVLDFGRSISKVAADFVVTFPPADPVSALIRIRKAL